MGSQDSTKHKLNIQSCQTTADADQVAPASAPTAPARTAQRSNSDGTGCPRVKITRRPPSALPCNIITHAAMYVGQHPQCRHPALTSSLELTTTFSIYQLRWLCREVACEKLAMISPKKLTLFIHLYFTFLFFSHCIQ